MLNLKQTGFISTAIIISELVYSEDAARELDEIAKLDLDLLDEVVSEFTNRVVTMEQWSALKKAQRKIGVKGERTMLKNPEKTKNDIVQWIRDYFAQNGPSCDAVIGISGGKDSSVTAALLVEALGKDRVIGVLMPNGVQCDISDSEEIVSLLGIPHVTINIKAAVDGLAEEINARLAQGALEGSTALSRDSMINLPPRIRMSTLYAIGQARPNGARVVNTCNRSEDYIGYSTKFGDAAGDFSPMSHLLVHEVIQIGDLLGLPERLTRKTPSDGLSGLSDEDKIGFTYAVLDHYILTGECDDEETRKKIDRMHALNLHKLQLMPAFSLEEDAQVPNTLA